MRRLRQDRRARGFTLIELLTVITIIAVLTAVLIPTIGKVMANARRSSAANNLRQIAIAYNDYTGQGGQQRVLIANTAHEFALILAREVGLNDPELFLIPEDPLVASKGAPLPVAVGYPGEAGNWSLDERFAEFPLSFTFLSNVSLSAPASTTPLAWTRGLGTDGTWRPLASESPGVYGSDGGHIVFLDGHVEFYRDLRGTDGQPVLQHYTTRRPTANILEAIPPGAVVLEAD